jgi:6-phosphofructokinase 2
MGKIVTLTVNPTIDKSVSVPLLLPEKKLKCTIPVYEPGGGGINVSRAIRKLGGDSLALYTKGGYIGDRLEKLLSQEGVTSQPVRIFNHTRENLTVLDESSNLQYRFGMPGPQIEDHEWNQCLEQINVRSDIEFLIASGSLSPGVPIDFFGKVACLAKKKNIKLVVDTSGDALKTAIQEGVYLIKPNLAELAFLAGKDELLPDQIIETARDLIKISQAEIVVVSMGPAGAFVVTETVERLISAPSVKRKSTVGAGDSMVAGIVLSLFAGKEIVEAVQFGVACGTAATMNAGTELCRKEDAYKLLELIRRETYA